MENYITLPNGIIKQQEITKISYDYEYSNNYNNYGEKNTQFSFLRLGILLGALGKTPDSILDVGYGNGDFLKIASKAIPQCYGSDISNYPVPDGITRVELTDNKYYDVICFFDSLEHFDDISIIKDLNCEYIFISIPWCHNFTTKWFEKWYHRKPNEHLWHFNKPVLIDFFLNYGFECIYSSNFEDIVRKNPNSKYYPNILSCIFKKKDTMQTRLANYYKNKKIVVTGGTGFIGRNIINELLTYDIAHIIIFDRTIKHKWENSTKITYIEGNLLYDLNQLEDCEFDILFHEAANVDTTCTDETNMVDTNYHAFTKLIKICENKNANIIYASSAAVYGNTEPPNKVGINESPLNIYGKSKLMMDTYIRENKDNLKIIATGIRYFNVYGPGESHKNKMMSMVSQMINKIKNNENVNLFKYGEQSRDFVYVKDVAHFNLLTALHQTAGIYNCGYGESVNFNTIFEIITSYYKNESSINYIENIYSFFQNETKADISSSIRDLNYTPKHNIIDGIYNYNG
jgi:ADP-L-glycero-D-manno-heptose 6-epimerase